MVSTRRVTRVLAATVAVAVSRVYLGSHWLTDVIAGALLAVAITMVAAVAALLVTGSRRTHGDRPLTS